MHKSKIKEKQEAPTIPNYATVDESQKFQEVPPDYAEKDKFITTKKRIEYLCGNLRWTKEGMHFGIPALLHNYLPPPSLIEMCGVKAK